MGSTIRFAMAVAASGVLANAPASRPIDRKARVPAMISGIAIHQ